MARESNRVSSGLRWVFLAVLAILLTACTAPWNRGPQYAKPSTPVPPAFKEAGASGIEGDWKPSQPSDHLARGKWWEAFQDPALNELEEKTNISNQNIAAAAASVQQARAMIRQARSQYQPTLTVNPSITNSRISTGFGKQLGVVFPTYSLPFEASWEPDLWGRVRNTVNANTYAAQASAADLENVRLSAQSDLATDYFELRAQDSLKRLYDATVVAYREALDLNRSLYQSGLGNDEAIAQAETQLKTAEAQDLNLGVLRAQYEHAIALLIGQPASTFEISKEAARMIVPPIPLGVPSQLLERRPDIAAAERAVAQANAQIGLAKTAYFPAITLSAAAGLQSVSIANWLTWPSRIWSVGPSLAQTIFDGGLRRATVQQYQAAYDQTVANYRQTALTAFQQVEDNLAALRILTQVLEVQESAIESAARNYEEAEVRYRAGLDPYLNVIAAQTILLSDQQAAVTYEAQRIVASVQLIKALGGGWDASQIPSAKELAATEAKAGNK